MADRYALREDHPGKWTVYDVFTGQPALYDDSILDGMDIQDADEMAEILNLQDALRRAASERP